MSHHDHRAPELAAEARERFEHDLLVALVEFGGRFVGEDERRLARGRGGDRHPLLLPAGEGACARSLSPAQVEGVERVGNSVIDPPAAGKPQRERRHGTGAENLEHVVELERAERQLLAPLGLAPEACYRHRKLSIINRYASTLSTPSGVPRSTIASLPACER